MLDKQDLQAIQTMIDTSVNASEERMTAKMDSLEERMTGKIDAAVAASENRILAYIENAVMPNFKLLAEGQQTILQTMARKDRVEALENEVVFLKSVVKNLAQDVAELKKAQ